MGGKWVFPFNLRDPRNVSQELGFSYQDATGSLYAVYEFLERLGLRWFMPVADLGEVVPEHRDIAIAPMDLKREPCFASRWLFLCGWGNHRASRGTDPGTPSVIWRKSETDEPDPM